MNRIIELAVLGLGGLSLFVVAFLGFAAMSGAPLDELAVVGPLFAEEEGEEIPEEERSVLDPPDQVYTTRKQVIEANLGLLSAYALEPPLSAVDLQSLATDLKAQKIAFEERLKLLDDREAALEQREEVITAQFNTLEEMRRDLERRETDLTLRAAEVERDEAAIQPEGGGSWATVAKIFEGGEAADMAKRLSAYTPEEAAQILSHLDDAYAVELLNAIGGDQFKSYVDAYSAAKR